MRALIPPARAGSYLLYAGAGVSAHYNGRSDHDLAARLAGHTRRGSGEYFSYDIHHDATTAYLAECAAFHLRSQTARNLIHPASPRRLLVACPFCAVRGLSRGLSVRPVVSEPVPATTVSKEN